MANEYDWIPQTANNVANMFGLNPKAQAEGRRLQAGADYDAARTKNVEAETGLIPLKGDVYKSQANANNAQAGKYNADTGKTNAETKGIEATNIAREIIRTGLSSGKISVNPENGLLQPGPTATADDVNGLIAAFGSMTGDPGKNAEGLQGIAALLSKTPIAAARARGNAAAFNPNAAGDANEAAALRKEEQAGKENIQRIDNEGRIAAAIAANSQGGQPNMQPRLATAREVMDLLAQDDPNLNQGARVVLASQIIEEQRRTGSDVLTAYDAVLKRRNITRGTVDAPGLFTGDNPVLRQGGGLVTEQGVRPPPPAPAAPGTTPPANPAPSAPPAPAAQGNQNLPVITNDQAGREAYARLAPGSRYVHPDGSVRVKR